LLFSYSNYSINSIQYSQVPTKVYKSISIKVYKRNNLLCYYNIILTWNYGCVNHLCGCINYYLFLCGGKFLLLTSMIIDSWHYTYPPLIDYNALRIFNFPPETTLEVLFREVMVYTGYRQTKKTHTSLKINTFITPLD